MENYFLKTKHNTNKTSEIEAAIESVGLNSQSVNEFFGNGNEDIKSLLISSVPAVIAVHTDSETGEKTVIHQEDSPFQMATFQATADSKLADFLAE